VCVGDAPAAGRLAKHFGQADNRNHVGRDDVRQHLAWPDGGQLVDIADVANHGNQVSPGPGHDSRCQSADNPVGLRYEPVPLLSPAYVLAVRIVRSLLVLLISAAALGMGAFITFPISRSPLPLFGIGIMLFGVFGLYTIYRDWRHGDRPAGFQRK
jgi:hypothetical protein